ncbi:MULTISPECIES: hypothetical protein [Azospirillum]|uniref:Uncharacterized protein n=1 Tax=Azospirillum brasilense TaxID=192 RepID=A0ABU4PGN0_AZOBR|nr:MULTISPECIES: hypothetical protein [Azospirillum]MDX5955946.1 hypothetical protein [Azospirillum brasilense]PWC88168.1 hypothetical protein AEJ54_24365 [Azospirillum sp. Sp 7]
MESHSDLLVDLVALADEGLDGFWNIDPPVLASGGAEWNAGGNGGTNRAGIAGHGLATVASKKVVEA